MQSQIMLLKPDKAISTKYTKNLFGSLATPLSYLVMQLLIFSCKILVCPQLLDCKHDYYSAQLQEK